MLRARWKILGGLALALGTLPACMMEEAAPGTTPEATAQVDSALSGRFVTNYSRWTFPGGTFYNKDIQITIDRDPGPGSNYFYAHQFELQNTIGYLGLQTDANRGNGTFGKIFIFSIWDALGGAAGSPGSWCQKFGGEGVGMSCRIPYDWQAGRTYRLRLWAFGQNDWGAWVLDQSTGIERHVGRIFTDGSRKHGWLTGASTAFTEYYGPDFASCNDLHFGRVKWWNPTANANSIKGGFSNNWLGNGACSSYRSSLGKNPAVHTMGYNTAPTGCGTMTAGKTLTAGGILWSCDKRFALVMQTDGNLVLYKAGGGALWSSGTYGTKASLAMMQGDGNFVVYDTALKYYWASNTAGRAGAVLKLQNDGNLVIYYGGKAVWNSGTCCH